MKVTFQTTHMAPEGATHYGFYNHGDGAHVVWYRLTITSGGVAEWSGWNSNIRGWRWLQQYTNRHPDHIKRIERINYIQGLIS